MKLWLLSWNVRGANNWDKRKVIKALIIGIWFAYRKPRSRKCQGVLSVA